MSVLEMSHQRESLPLHAITPRPQTRDVITAQGTMRGDGVVLHLLGSLESHHALGPLTHEWFLGVDADTLHWSSHC